MVSGKEKYSSNQIILTFDRYEMVISAQAEHLHHAWFSNGFTSKGFGGLTDVAPGDSFAPRRSNSS